MGASQGLIVESMLYKIVIIAGMGFIADTGGKKRFARRLLQTVPCESMSACVDDLSLWRFHQIFAPRSLLYALTAYFVDVRRLE